MILCAGLVVGLLVGFSAGWCIAVYFEDAPDKARDELRRNRIWGPLP